MSDQMEQRASDTAMIAELEARIAELEAEIATARMEGSRSGKISGVRHGREIIRKWRIGWIKQAMDTPSDAAGERYMDYVNAADMLTSEFNDEIVRLAMTPEADDA